MLLLDKSVFPKLNANGGHVCLCHNALSPSTTHLVIYVATLCAPNLFCQQFEGDWIAAWSLFISILSFFLLTQLNATFLYCTWVLMKRFGWVVQIYVLTAEIHGTQMQQLSDACSRACPLWSTVCGCSIFLWLRGSPAKKLHKT